MQIRLILKDTSHQSVMSAVNELLTEKLVGSGKVVRTMTAGGYIVRCRTWPKALKSMKGAVVMNYRFSISHGGRRALVQAIGEILGCEARYQGAPTFSYAVGGLTLDRESMLHIPPSVSRETTAWLMATLTERGYTAEADDVSGEQPADLADAPVDPTDAPIKPDRKKAGYGESDDMEIQRRMQEY